MKKTIKHLLNMILISLVSIALAAVAIAFPQNESFADSVPGTEDNPYNGLPRPTIIISDLDDSGDLIYCGIDLAVFVYNASVDGYVAKPDKIIRYLTDSKEIDVDLGSTDQYEKGLKHFLAIRALYNPVGISNGHGEPIIIADESGETEGWTKVDGTYFIISHLLNKSASGSEGLLWHTPAWAQNLYAYNSYKEANFGEYAELRSENTYWLGEKFIVRILVDEVPDSLSVSIEGEIDTYEITLSDMNHNQFLENGVLYHEYTGELWDPRMVSEERWGNSYPENLDVAFAITKDGESESTIVPIIVDNKDPFWRTQRKY